jgi:hypothetical protein
MPLQASPPATRLPTEILAKIFESTVTLDKTEFSSHGMQWHLVRVCRYWRAVMMAYPCLWSSLVFPNVRVTAAMLRRSKEAPLVVKTKNLIWKPQVKDAILLALFNLSRIRVLHIQGLSSDLYYSIITAMVDRAAPLLESLHLTFQQGHPRLIWFLPSLFASRAPRLRHVTFSRASDPWSLPILRNLTHLEIRDNTLAPSLSEFHDVLSHCPALDTLILVNALLPTSGELQPLVSLPRLSHLHLADCLAGCDFVVQNISFPPTTAVTLHPNVTRFQLLQLQPFVANLCNKVSTITRLRLKIDHSSIRAQAWTSPEPHSIENPSLDLFFKGVNSNTFFQTTYAGLVLTQLVCLEVAVYSLAQYTWEAILDPLKNLQSLIANSPDVDDLISALRPSPEHAAPSLPRLRKLVLRGVDFRHTNMYALLMCLVQRRNNNARIEKLRLIDWVELPKSSVDLLREVMGDNVVEWD